MGCDIHCWIERRVPGKDHWENCGAGPDDRNYNFFAALADVRNYHGIPMAGSTLLLLDSGDRSTWPDASHAFLADLEYWGDDLHTPGYITLAAAKAYDLTQLSGQETEFGRFYATMSPAPTDKLEPKPVSELVGETWTALVRALQERQYLGQSDEDVRLIFAFDN